MEHHDHPHDHHGDTCSCGHHHGEAHCPYHIHGHIHEGAAAVSGSLTLPGDVEAQAISRMLEGLGAQVRCRGGIIGHIKASAARRSTTLFSVTKDTATVTPCEGSSLDVSVTVIAFAVELETVESLLHDALEQLEKENAQ